jgi:flagellar L-ring protein FlgH
VTRSDSFVIRLMLAVLFCLAAAMPVRGQQQSASDAAAASAIKSSATYEELYQKYLQTARAADAGPAEKISWMTNLASDRRAFRVNDLLTIKVVESISAAGSADANLSKDNSASASMKNLFGLENKLPSSMDPSNLVNTASNTKFTGGGATNRAGELSAVMTVRVAEVLPNGYLVLEGAREIAINGDRQMLVVTGVVRTTDIMPNNVVLSTQVGQMSIRYFGNGLIKDALKPGILVRLLNKVF